MDESRLELDSDEALSTLSNFPALDHTILGVAVGLTFNELVNRVYGFVLLVDALFRAPRDSPGELVTENKSTSTNVLAMSRNTHRLRKPRYPR